MEARSPVIAKRLWNVLRITFFMVRKGLISKRRLIMDMNLMIKRGRLLRKSVSNLLSTHHHHHRRSNRSIARGSFGIQEYEFSCSNSPNPVFSHLHKRRHHFRFPCIDAPEVIGEENEDELHAVEAFHHGHLKQAVAVALVPKTPEYSFNIRFDASDLGPGEKKSPMLSPFSVRVSNYSSEEYNDREITGDAKFVDDKAEDFIRRFYQQLKAQSGMQLLQYQETD